MRLCLLFLSEVVRPYTNINILALLEYIKHLHEPICSNHCNRFNKLHLVKWIDTIFKDAKYVPIYMFNTMRNIVNIHNQNNQFRMGPWPWEMWVGLVALSPGQLSLSSIRYRLVINLSSIAIALLKEYLIWYDQILFSYSLIY